MTNTLKLRAQTVGLSCILSKDNAEEALIQGHLYNNDGTRETRHYPHPGEFHSLAEAARRLTIAEDRKARGECILCGCEGHSPSECPVPESW